MHTESGPYRNLYFHHHGIKYKRMVGRLVLTAFYRDPRPGEIAFHIDGDSLNDELENLTWARRRDLIQPYILIEELERVFSSLREAGAFLGVDNTTVMKAARTGRRVKGFTITLLE